MPASEPSPPHRSWQKANDYRRFLTASWESLATLIFPPVCVLCSEPTSTANVATSSRRYATFCRTCETSLIQSQPMMRTACEQCGWPRMARSPQMRVQPGDDPDEIGSSGVSADEPELLPCPKCQARDVPHRFHRITPLYRYHDAARDAVVAAKYPRNSAVSRELAARLADRLRSRWPDLTPQRGSKTVQPIVISVPAPWLRQLRRGGSGTRLLAQYTARNLGLSYASLLQTNRQVAKQALLDDDQRRENVRGAFRIRRSWLKNLPGRDVLLVDDVMTTGATADEIADVLMAAGVGRVSLAVVALAMRDG